MRSSMRRPHKRVIVNALLPQFHNFISVIQEFAIKFRLCGVSPSCRCNGGGHAHIQGRTASRDSSGGEDISRSGLGSGELQNLQDVFDELSLFPESFGADPLLCVLGIFPLEHRFQIILCIRWTVGNIEVDRLIRKSTQQHVSNVQCAFVSEP